jgi:hypothetical protein
MEISRPRTASNSLHHCRFFLFLFRLAFSFSRSTEFFFALHTLHNHYIIEVKASQLTMFSRRAAKQAKKKDENE